MRALARARGRGRLAIGDQPLPGGPGAIECARVTEEAGVAHRAGEQGVHFEHQLVGVGVCFSVLGVVGKSSNFGMSFNT